MTIRQALRKAMWDARMAKDTYNRDQRGRANAFIRSYFGLRNRKHVIFNYR